MAASEGGLNCTVPDGPIDVNPDITGIGALASFFITALATIGALVLAYCSNSLADSSLNHLDRTIISRIQKIWTPIHSRWTSWRQSQFSAVAKRCPWVKHSASQQGIPHDARQEAFTRFILALSDQQLVTGLAMLIGGVANQKRLTLYEFQVLLSLAWFSSTTHLATLGVLEDYFRAHPILRNWRVFGMVVLLILLSYTFFLATFAGSIDPTVPIQCLFQPQLGTIQKRSAGGDPLFAISLVTSLLTIYIVLSSYTSRILNLYGLGQDQLTILAPKVLLRWMGRSRLAVHLHDPLLLPADRAASRVKSLARIGMARRSSLSRSSLSQWVQKWRSFEHGYGGSFLSTFSRTSFSLSYGIFQVVLYRWAAQPALAPGTSRMEFGQITPLFLLFLPIFAAAEIYYESRRPNVDGNDSSSNTITSPDHRSISSSLRPPISTTQLGDIDTEYDQKIAEIKEYYFIETVQVAHAETLAREDDDRKEIQLTKAAILHAFEVAKRFERNLPVALTLAVSALGIASNLLLGYLLNSTGGLEVIAASALFLFNLAADLVASLSDVYRSPANWTIVGERLSEHPTMAELRRSLDEIVDAIDAPRQFSPANSSRRAERATIQEEEQESGHEHGDTEQAGTGASVDQRLQDPEG